MDSSKRIAVNTLAQYAKTIINTLLSLYATRLVLGILGDVDYGIYSLVAGVISMLAFITNALVITTQRYLSFYHGRKDLDKMKAVFSNSLSLHIVVGIVISFALYLIMPLIFSNSLNIPTSRINEAHIIYYISILILFSSFITAPFRAVLISNENIVFISIVDVFDGILKVALVLLLCHWPIDKLIGYVLILLGVQIFNFIILSVFSFCKYQECIVPRVRYLNKQYIQELSLFAGWTVYSVGCITGRTQGVALCLNRFFGSAINAAYGLAFQVSGFFNFISSSLLNAISPQIIKAEGDGNRKRMLSLSTLASKWAYLLLATVSIPAFFEMPAILEIWLGDVPDHTALFCRMVILASLIDTSSLSLGTANQATGKIRNYSLTINTIKLLTIPIVLIILFLSGSLLWVAVSFVCVELICALLRIPFLHATTGLDMWDFIKSVYGKSLLPTLINVVVCFLITYFVDMELRWILTFCISAVIFLVSIYYFSLSNTESQAIKEYVKKFL